MHSYSSYANIVWPSAHKAKLKKLLSQQKQTYQIIFHELRNAHSQPLLKRLKTLNIFQINIYRAILSMLKIKINEAPAIIQSKFQSQITNT